MKKSIHSPGALALAAWLAEKRQAAGLSQRQLAEKMGIHHSILGKLETGERRLDVVELVQYCEYVDANPLDATKTVMKTRSQK